MSKEELIKAIAERYQRKFGDINRKHTKTRYFTEGQGGPLVEGHTLGEIADIVGERWRSYQIDVSHGYEGDCEIDLILIEEETSEEKTARLCADIYSCLRDVQRGDG